jgi:NCS1 family nucleobase:cation symporter-1
MASDDNKLFYDEKNGSPAASAVEPDASQTGHVSGIRRRLLPGFSLEVRQEESSFAATARASNADFDPIPPSKRTWNWGAYVAYWMADAWAVSNWEVGESPRGASSVESRESDVHVFKVKSRERGGAEILVVQLLP